MLGLLLVFVAIALISSVFNVGMGWGLLILLLIVIGIPLVISFINDHLRDKKESEMKEKFRDPSTSEEEKERIREYFRQKQLKEKETEKNLHTLQTVKYIGGHEEYTRQSKVGVVLREDELIFTEWGKKDNIYFTIPTNEIEDVKYGKSEEVSFGRYLAFGLASVVLQKKTYYMLIEYVNRYGVRNQVFLETGEYREQEFINKLNAVRNQAKKGTGSRVSNTINRRENPMETIEQLAQLRKKGILTEEEFTKKKSELLSKIQ